MPFTEQEVATTFQEVHSLLLQWTTALWGEPIVLTDSAESNAQAGDFQADAQEGALPPTLPARSSCEETETVESHRRRRLHVLGTPLPPSVQVRLTLVGSPVYFGRFPGFYFGLGFGDLAERKQLTATP